MRVLLAHSLAFGMDNCYGSLNDHPARNEVLKFTQTLTTE